MPYFKIQVPDTYNLGQRLDKYIATVPNSVNRSQLKNGVTSLLLNGAKTKLSVKVKAGDIIELDWEENVPDDITPENIPLNIIYEDDDITVVNKKQGMVTHPANGNWSGTLVNALLYHWGRGSLHQDFSASDQEKLALRRPGIVHRLDKDTSGVIITAKHIKAEEWLSAQFRNHKKLHKDYICICVGHPKENKGLIETQITRDPKDRKKFKACENTMSGKYAATSYRVIASYGPYTLIHCRLRTGRTHQIRVHMKYIGCPILGDPIYGRKTTGTLFDTATLMLHAYRLTIRIPSTKAYKTFTAPVPVRFLKVLKTLHNNFQKAMPQDKKY